MKRLFLITLMLVLLVSSIFIGCAKSTTTTAPATTTAATGPLLIGSIGPRTGWAAVYGTDGQDVKLAYADYYNARGGINGRQIKIIEYDNESKPENDVLYVKKLIETDKVLAILGPIINQDALAAIGAAKFQGCPLIYDLPLSIIPEISQPGSNIFGIDAPPGRYFMATVSRLKEKYGVKKLAILTTSDENGQEDIDWITEATEKLGGIQIVETERIDPDAIDATPQLTRIMAANPDAIHLGGGGTCIGPIMKGIQLLNINLPVAGATGFVGKEMFDLIKGYEPKEFFFPVMMPQVAALNVLPADDPIMSIANKMVDIWQAKYGETRGNREQILFSWIGWDMDSMDLIVKAINEAGPLPADVTLARKAINDALENKIVGLVQLLGTRTMTPTDHIGLSLTGGVILVTSKNGAPSALQD